MTAQNTNTALELALLLLLATLWSASYTFIKIGIETIPPITLIAGRTLIAGLFLLAVIHLRGQRLPLNPRTWSKFMFQAVLNTAIPFTLIAWSELRVDAGLAIILNSTTPIFTFLITALITQHEPVTLRKLLGVVIGLAGISLIIGMEAFGGLGDEVWSQLAIIVATISFAAAAIFGKNFVGLDPLMPAAGSLLCGAALLIPASLAVDHPWALQPSLRSLGALLGLAVFSTALAFAIYFRLLQTLGSVSATAQAYIRVPIGVGLSMLVLGETLQPTAWIGLPCVIAGVIAMTLPSARAKPIAR